MAEKRRGRRLRPWYLLMGALALGVVLWLLSPTPFIRGVVLGALLGPAVLIAGLSLIARRLRGRISENLRPPPLPVFRWDFEMTAEDLDGHPVAFKDFAGRVLILNFWATWCAPCVAEMPSLARLRASTADHGVVLACVTRETPETVRAFVAKRGIDVPVYILNGEVPEGFESRAIPATFVLDKKGNVALRHFGAAAWDHGEVVDFVRALAQAPEL
jgi:thiol-disulfide isomerase/thioredoxin